MRKRFEFTAETMAHLRACHAQGMSKVGACLELGTSTGTVDRAAKRAGMYDELKALFPHGGKHREILVPEIVDGMRKLAADQPVSDLGIDMRDPHVIAATMQWRP